MLLYLTVDCRYLVAYLQQMKYYILCKNYLCVSCIIFMFSSENKNLSKAWKFQWTSKYKYVT